MIIDGISDSNRGTWSRLTRLHTASVSLPMATSHIAESDSLADSVTTL